MLPNANELLTHAADAAQLLKALANPYRLQILCVLGAGEKSVSALNAHVQLSQSALSQHLAVLRGDGLVTTRRESQTMFYRVADGAAVDVIKVLHRHFCGNQGKPGARRKQPGGTTLQEAKP